MPNEFKLITDYFDRPNRVFRKDVLRGIGDDCAVVRVPANKQLAVSIDTLVAGVHFPENTPASDIGHKALAVNLSDLAAAGAAPCWVTLALTLPEFNTSWLKAFSAHFFALAKKFNVQLIGGDTTHGPLSVTIQAHGLVPKNKIISRSGAKPGDLIYVTNTVGNAGLALMCLQNKMSIPTKDRALMLQHLNRPMPRVKEGLLLRRFVSAMIDVSDGLAADLSHILEQSGVGAVLQVEDVPLSAVLKKSLPKKKAREMALGSGDDYELCFTVPVGKRAVMEKVMRANKVKVSCVGEIVRGKGLRLVLRDGKKFLLGKKGYLHF